MVRRFIALVLLAVFVAGCADSFPAGDAPPKGDAGGAKKLRLAVIPKGTTHEFWKSVHLGAKQAGDEFGAEILWLGPLHEQDKDGQITVVQNFLTQRVDGIVLAPIDSQALVGPVSDAWEEGILTVIFDSGLDLDRLRDPKAVVSYVATDNYHGGQLAAEEIARRLPDGGDVILLRYMAGSQSTLEPRGRFSQRASASSQI